MNSTTLHIKNMVCNRCIKVVKDEFEKIHLSIEEIELGKVKVSTLINEEKLNNVRELLIENGFELIDDKKSQLIDNIKTLIIERIHHGKDMPETLNCSDIITAEIGYDYSYLSNLFSSVEGITIEKYIIHQKIEKAKELLVYNELSLKEISYQLGYSSVQYLSNQFKKVSGLTPSHFKKLKENKRKPLDKM
ncbi:MAG: helix-turn-helix domain-containing protein [Bacteroidales bacterium]|nr:helix-turn-helix domain-containing protein [Bacteroidales bacterium]